MNKIKYLLVFGLLLASSFGVFSQTAKPSKNIPAAEHYAGGQDSMYAYIQRTVKYPAMAKRNRIQGECIVNLIIEADGKTKDFHIVKNIGAGCGEEAARIVSLLKFKAPGYRLQTSIPIIFKL